MEKLLIAHLVSFSVQRGAGELFAVALVAPQGGSGRLTTSCREPPATDDVDGPLSLKFDTGKTGLCLFC